MGIDRDKDAKAGKETTPSKNQSTTPSGPPESPWIMHSLNQILEQIDKAEKRIQEQLNGLEARLRRFERLFWICQGLLIAVLIIWAVVQLLISNYQISFTLKP